MDTDVLVLYLITHQCVYSRLCVRLTDHMNLSELMIWQKQIIRFTKLVCIFYGTYYACILSPSYLKTFIFCMNTMYIFFDHTTTCPANQLELTWRYVFAYSLHSWLNDTCLHILCTADLMTCVYDYIHYKVWAKINYPFPNFNGATVDVSEWISTFISHFIEHAIT